MFQKKTLVATMLTVFTASAAFLYGPDLLAFCGFYVAKADARLFNQASRVVLARDGDRTVLTMANDYQGDLRDFAIVIPTPTFLEREQINVAEPALIDRIDAFTAPRLVEYFDENPCDMRRTEFSRITATAEDSGGASAPAQVPSRGVTIEARYAVGEYDILILSAQESSGLELWLRENGYRIPNGATEVLGSYIRQNMRFFVARVNLAEQAAGGRTYLRPLQIAYESPKFMLPIRLGTVNANGPQELFVFGLSPRGRIETTNYRTVRIPTNSEVPIFIKNEFSSFYRDMFSLQVKKEDMRAVFLEHAWDMGWCDPCAADPLSPEELRKLGVFWLNEAATRDGSQGVNAFVTRLHLRYTAESFPSDLVFQETGDRQNFQGRYVLRHPYQGAAECSAGKEYRRGLVTRRESEAQTLAGLTGWNIDLIRQKMGVLATTGPTPGPGPAPWWRRVFQN
jgi:hypothetical protein